MADTTGIQWTDATWNPVTGCTKVSQGCKHCYAERLAPRVFAGQEVQSGTGWGESAGEPRPRRFTDVRCHPERLGQPFHWRKPRRVFVNSMSDLFHEDVPDNFIAWVFSVMASAPQHTFQVLTKRPGRQRDFVHGLHWTLGISAPTFAGTDRPELLHTLAHDGHIEGGYRKPEGWMPPNVWLGVSVEDQATADERIPLLLDTPAAVCFVSYEPALGPVDLGPALGTDEVCLTCARMLPEPALCTCGTFLDWVIVGGESGPNARPFDLAWARSVVDQCREAGVACFVKQLGRRPVTEEGCPNPIGLGTRYEPVELRDSHGGDWDEWPPDLRVREWPASAVPA